MSKNLLNRNRRIVPMQLGSPALGKTITKLDVDLVSARATGGNLIEQLGQLRGRRNCLVSGAQPVAQHIGLAHSTQTLNLLDDRWYANQLKVLQRHFQQYRLGLCRIRRATGKGVAKLRERCLPVSYTHLRAHETDSYLVC